MAATAYESLPNGVHDDDHVLRPRPRKPLHTQVSQLSVGSAGSNLDGPENGTATGMTRCDTRARTHTHTHTHKE